jgi:hypothetical protein
MAEIVGVSVPTMNKIKEKMDLQPIGRRQGINYYLQDDIKIRVARRRRRRIQVKLGDGLNSREAARHIGMPRAKLTQNYRRWGIPCYVMPDKSLLFIPYELDEWIISGTGKRVLRRNQVRLRKKAIENRAQKKAKLVPGPTDQGPPDTTGTQSETAND